MDSKWEIMHGITGINKETANILVKPLGPKKEVESIELLPGGRSTANYKIRIKGLNQIFILRIYPEVDNVCHKEFMVHNTVKDYIPVPEIYYINDEGTVIGKPYAILQFLEGMMLNQYAAQNNGIDKILAEEIGEKLGCLHQKEYDREGYLDENLNLIEGRAPILSWYDYFLNNRAGERLGSRMKTEVFDCLEDNNHLLVHITQKFVLSHGDFRPSNIMVKAGRLTGILDWEKSLAAPVYYDIGQFIRYMEYVKDSSHQSFVTGYNRFAKNPVPDEWRKMAKLTDLAGLLWVLNVKEDKTKLFSDIKNLIKLTIQILK